MASNEISVTNSQWYFYSVFPLWKRQTNLISCHFKTLTSKKCIIQFHTQGLRHALHILSSKTNAIRILNQIKPKWQLRGERVQTQDLDFWCFYPRLASTLEIKPWVGWVWNKLFAGCVWIASIELKWFGNIPGRQLWPNCNSLFLPKPAPGPMFTIVSVLVCTMWAHTACAHNQVMVGVAEGGVLLALGYIPVIPRLWGRWPKNHHNPTHQ